MGHWLQDLPVTWMALVVFGATYLVTAGIFVFVNALATSARVRSVFKGMSPGMLPPLGIIFGLLVAFTAAQVWNDIDHAKAAVNREASALRSVVLLARAFPGEPETRIRELIQRHIEDTARDEWISMAQQSASLKIMSVPLTEALQVSLALVPHTEGQITGQREMVTQLEEAMDARRQRIVLSGSSVNWVKWSCLLLQAACMLIAIAMVHCDNRGASAVALGVFATGVAVSIVLIASHARPFSGEISVTPEVLRQVMPESQN